MAELTDHDPLFERVRPAFEWIDVEHRCAADDRAYEDAVENLRAELDRKRSNYDTLADLGEAVSACGRGIPRDLAARLSPRLKELSKIWWWQTLAKGTAALAGLIVAGFLLFQFLTERRLAQNAEAVAANLNQHLDAGLVEDASNKKSGLPPNIIARAGSEGASTAGGRPPGRTKAEGNARPPPCTDVVQRTRVARAA